MIVFMYSTLYPSKFATTSAARVVSRTASTVAILLLLGQSLSLFNLVALLLVFGIGVDYGLFFSRQEADVRMRQRTFHALTVCALSTVSVFGILSFSVVPVLQDIGLTVWVGVLLSFVFALLLSQPAAAPAAASVRG